MNCPLKHCVDTTQGRNHNICLGKAKPMGGHKMPPPLIRDRVNLSEILGKAAALPSLPYDYSPSTTYTAYEIC